MNKLYTLIGYPCDCPLEEGWGVEGGAVVIALTSHQCDPGSSPAQWHVWAEFIVGSLLAPMIFLWVLRFSSLPKTQHF